MAGYAGDPAVSCSPIDACQTSPCDPNAICLDYPAPSGPGVDGRSCMCNTGYTGDGNLCVLLPVVESTTAVVAASGGNDSSSSSDSNDLMLMVVAGLLALLLLVAVIALLKKSGPTVVQDDWAGAAEAGREDPAFVNPVYSGTDTHANTGYLDVEADQGTYGVASSQNDSDIDE